MSKFTTGDNNYVDATNFYAKIKRLLKSYVDVNLVDENDFPIYTAEIIDRLEQAAWKEEVAVVKIKDGKGKLPEDFKRLYFAYKCGCLTTTLERKIQQGLPHILEDHIKCDYLKRSNDCEFSCQSCDSLIQRVEIRRYVNEGALCHTYDRIEPLTLSPNAKKYCDPNCRNIHISCINEITIDGKYIYTNFNDGDVYLEYYAFPLNEDGFPTIPDNQLFQKALEYYIIWQLLLSFYLNSDAPDIMQKAREFEVRYNQAYAEYKHYKKVPSFNYLVNTIKKRKSNSLQAIITKNYSR